MSDKKPFGKTFLCFGPKQDSDWIISEDGMMARRGTPQAEWISKHKTPTTEENGIRAIGDFLVGPNGIARRGTPQAESISKRKPPAKATQSSKSKLQAIKPIQNEETVSASQSQVKEESTAAERNPMKTTPTNSSLADLIKDPAFRWTVLYILLAVLIFCLWPRDEYVSMGHRLILNKRTGEVHRAYERLSK